jgi:hypothetical protein
MQPPPEGPRPRFGVTVSPGGHRLFFPPPSSPEPRRDLPDPRFLAPFRFGFRAFAALSDSGMNGVYIRAWASTQDFDGALTEASGGP